MTLIRFGVKLTHSNILSLKTKKKGENFGSHKMLTIMLKKQRSDNTNRLLKFCINLTS